MTEIRATCECDNPIVVLDIDSSGRKIRLCRPCRGHIEEKKFTNVEYLDENASTEVRK